MMSAFSEQNGSTLVSGAGHALEFALSHNVINTYIAQTITPEEAYLVSDEGSQNDPLTTSSRYQFLTCHIFIFHLALTESNGWRSSSHDPKSSCSSIWRVANAVGTSHPASPSNESANRKASCSHTDFPRLFQFYLHSRVTVLFYRTSVVGTL